VFVVNCNFINNNNSTVTRLESCAVNIQGFFSCLTGKRRPNAPPDSLPALRRRRVSGRFNSRRPALGK
jgi:hypothetical protein